MSEEEKKVSSVEEYRNMVGVVHDIVLPSGQKFKVKKLSVMDYIKEGLTDIPNEFFSFIKELQTDGRIANPEAENAKESFKLFEKYLKISVEKGVINPPITFRYDKEKVDTHLLYPELSKEDQVFLVDYIVGKNDK